MNAALTTDLLVFAEQRATVQDRSEKALVGSARYALRHWGKGKWFDALLDRASKLLRKQYHADTGKWTSPRLRAAQKQFVADLRKTLAQTHKPESKEGLEASAKMIAASIATNATNLAAELAAEDDNIPDVEVDKVWITVKDERVRPTHRAAHGQRVPLSAKFEVGGSKMERPGDLTAPIDEWANCRCLLAIMVRKKAVAAAVSRIRDSAAPLAATDPTGGDMATDNTPVVDPEVDAAPEPPPEPIDIAVDPVPFWGVVAPEDVMSGDNRKFAAGALRSRPLPIPLSYQRVNEPGHDGSVRVGNIERMWRKNGLVFGSGHFLTSIPEADEAIGVMWESGGRMGVSVDADDGAAEMHTRDGQSLDEIMDGLEPGGEGVELNIDDLVTVFTTARAAGATLCNIPAFHEAFMAMGDVPDEFAPADGEDLAVESRDEAMVASISEKPWDGSASRFTDAEWKRSCIVHLSDALTKADHKLPIREPGGALSRAGVHAAASRIGQVDAPPAKISAAKSALRSAYKQLGEDPPEGLAVETDFGITSNPTTEDGPGWLTHPVDTDRLRDYWVRGPGAAKIGWGIPGDFNRCRAQLAKYIKPNYLSGYCANRHKDALGIWPGMEDGKRGHHSLAAAAGTPAEGETMRPALSLVAAVDLYKPPAEWFEDPHLSGPSPIVVTEEGRIFGHLATWGTCHIGISGVCTEAPQSVSDYAYFRTGYVLADNGEMIPTGNLTMDTGHADINARARVAMAHYDDTGTVTANVAAGEDEYGIWVAGAIPPGLPPEKVFAMRASVLSGDWRDIGGNLELVAALHVNVQGFPIPRTAIAASGGHQTALVAAGMVITAAGEPVHATVEEIVAKTLDLVNERNANKARMAELAAMRAANAREKMNELAERAGRH